MNNSDDTLFFGVICEYSPTGDTFQVVELRHQEGADYTFLVSSGEHFLSMDDLRKTMADRLGVEAAAIELEEI